jgi:hypothetical protein
MELERNASSGNECGQCYVTAQRMKPEHLVFGFEVAVGLPPQLPPPSPGPLALGAHR